MIQWLGLCMSTGVGPGSIPGQGTRIPQAAWQEKKVTMIIVLYLAIDLT